MAPGEGPLTDGSHDGHVEDVPSSVAVSDGGRGGVGLDSHSELGPASFQVERHPLVVNDMGFAVVNDKGFAVVNDKGFAVVNDVVVAAVVQGACSPEVVAQGACTPEVVVQEVVLIFS